MTRKFNSRTAFAAAVLAVGAAGSALFGGTALAGGHGTHDNTGGGGGYGGDANSNCAVPIGISLGVLGQGGPVSQCQATGGGGGNGGTGANY